MTAQERIELAHLYDQIIEWRREDSDRLMMVRDEIIEATKKAVDDHATDCHADRLRPMMKKVDWLYENAQQRCAEAQVRRRQHKLWYAAAVAAGAAIGTLTPYILHFL